MISRIHKLKKTPKKIIVIAIDGISVNPYGFIEWKEIKSACISARGRGTSGMDYFFEFKTKDNKVIEIPAFGLTKNIFQIRKIVKKYMKYYEEYVTPRYN